MTRVGQSKVAMILVSLVSVLLIVGGVLVAFLYRDNGDGVTANYVMIFMGFVATIVTNIVGLYKTHDVQEKLNEKQDQTDEEVKEQ